MGSRAPTPEDLDALLEDAVVMRDARAVAELFEEGGLLAVGAAAPARGGAQIARSAAAIWDGHPYVSEPRRVLQARDTALVVAARALHVTRRSGGGWRLAVSLVQAGRRDTWEEGT